MPSSSPRSKRCSAREAPSWHARRSGRDLFSPFPGDVRAAGRSSGYLSPPPAPAARVAPAGRDPVPVPCSDGGFFALCPRRNHYFGQDAPRSLPRSRITHLACSLVSLRTPGAGAGRAARHPPGQAPSSPCSAVALRGPGPPPVRLTSRSTSRSKSAPNTRGSSAPPLRAGPACARLLCSRCESALLLSVDSAQSAAADRRFHRHSADLLPRTGAPVLRKERNRSSSPKEWESSFWNRRPAQPSAGRPCLRPLVFRPPVAPRILQDPSKEICSLLVKLLLFNRHA